MLRRRIAVGAITVAGAATRSIICLGVGALLAYAPTGVLVCCSDTEQRKLQARERRLHRLARKNGLRRTRFTYCTSLDGLDSSLRGVRPRPAVVITTGHMKACGMVKLHEWTKQNGLRLLHDSRLVSA